MTMLIAVAAAFVAVVAARSSWRSWRRARAVIQRTVDELTERLVPPPATAPAVPIDDFASAMGCTWCGNETGVCSCSARCPRDGCRGPLTLIKLEAKVTGRRGAL